MEILQNRIYHFHMNHSRRRINMWIKKILVLIILLIIFFSWGYGGEISRNDIFPMPELTNPDTIVVDDQSIFISEGTAIFIFDREHLKLKKKFGKTGEGPREFMLNVMQGVERLQMNIRDDNLIINSLGKISFFDKTDGTYLRELKIPSRTSGIKPLGKHFAGLAMIFDKDTQYRTINLYNSRLNKIREIYRMKHHFQYSRRELKLGEDSAQFQTYRDRLYVAWDRDFIIRVYDQTGKPVRTIQPAYRRIKVTSGYRNKILTYLNTDQKYKNFMQQIKPKILFPEYFCAIAYFVISDRTLYIFTHGQKEEKNECIIMDLDGNQVKKVYLPLWQPDELQPSPFGIKDNKMYRLVEDGENWEMRMTAIL